MTDDEYLAWGKTSNSTELSSGDALALFRQLDQEEGFDELLEVPFALKHVRDVHVVMRHAVAEAGHRREDLTHHPLFHPAFTAFALGFAIGFAQAHRIKHMALRPSLAKLSRRQLELADEWGVQIATYYLAVVDADGIFGKDQDADLYGIADRWRLLGDEQRLDEFDRLKECVESGKRTARQWFEDDTADVPPHFVEALEHFIEANPDRVFG